MKTGTSLYLDILRFGAALTVFVAHYSSGRLSGGLFWEVYDYGHLAVIVFFVLSGLVIAYSTETKDRVLHAYCVNRLSRLYSVVVPAILVTIAADAIGTRVAPQLYNASWGYDASSPVLRVALALTFTSDIWFADYQIFSMGPFWSLPYEVWYYVLFAAVVFLPGRKRVWGAVLAMAIAGPRILFLLPVWLTGVVTYLAVIRLRLRPGVGWIMWFGSVAVFVLCQYFHIREHSKIVAEQLTSPSIIKEYCQMSWTPYDYLIGLMIACNIVGFHTISDHVVGLITPFKRVIRWLAGLTFSLYLFHMPLLHFYKAISPWPAGDTRNRILLLVITFLTVAALSRVTEHRRGILRDWLARIIPDARRWPFMGLEVIPIRGTPPVPLRGVAVVRAGVRQELGLGRSSSGSD